MTLYTLTITYSENGHCETVIYYYSNREEAEARMALAQERLKWFGKEDISTILLDHGHEDDEEFWKSVYAQFYFDGEGPDTITIEQAEALKANTPYRPKERG